VPPAVGDLFGSEEAAAVGAEDRHLLAGQVETHLQPRADEFGPETDRTQHLGAAEVGNESVGLGVVDVILLDAMLLVPHLLVDHLGEVVRRREDLEDDGHGHAVLFPLLVRGAVPLGPAKDDVHVRGLHDLWVILHRIPELVAGHEHLVIVAKHTREALVQQGDPTELFGVVGHGLAVALGVDDLGPFQRGGRGHEDAPFPVRRSVPR